MTDLSNYDSEPADLSGIEDPPEARAGVIAIRQQKQLTAQALQQQGERDEVEALQPYLILDARGHPRPNLTNAIVALQRLPALQGLSVFNEFTGQYELTRSPPLGEGFGGDMPGPYPHEWDDADVAWVQSYLQRRLRANFAEAPVRGALLAVAQQHRVHPAREEMARLQALWDGKPRLDSWMHDCLGVPRGAYEDAVAARTLIAAVRRVRHPGCKVDTITVLQGVQGIRKSTVIETLFGRRFYSDSIPVNWADKDAAIGLQGVMVVEIAEIEKVLEGTHSGAAKAFVSRSVDNFRPPYGKANRRFPRQSIMIGTTNQDEFLIDHTGNRRYWPVLCTRADVEWLEDNREQLWAEAAAREDLGEAHWLTDSAEVAGAQEKQAEAEHVDPWINEAKRWLENPERTADFPHPDMVTTSDLLKYGLGLPQQAINRQSAMRAGRVLRSLGWVKDRMPPSVVSDQRLRCFRRPDRSLF